MTGVVGRCRERAAIGQLLARLATGRGGVVVVEGSAGSGKSTLLDDALPPDSLRSDGRPDGPDVLVVRARGGGTTSRTPWAIASQLVEGLLGGLDAAATSVVLDGPAGRAMDLTRHDPVSDDGSPSSAYAVAHGVCCAVRDASRLRPILLVVDDAHELDRSSATVLATLVDRIDDGAYGLLIARRPPGDELVEPGSELDAAMSSEHVRRLVLGPLDDHDIGIIVDRWHPAATERIRREIIAATRGNPLLAREAAEACALAGRGDALDDLIAGDDASLIRRTTLARLGAAGDGADRLAAAIGVLGEHTTVGRAARLSGLDHQRARELVARLHRHGVVAYEGDRPVLRHPLVERMVLAEAGTAHVDSMHRAAAAILWHDGVDPDAVVAHLMSCVDIVPPEPWMVGCLRRVAARRLALGAPATAADMLRRAGTVAVDPIDRIDVALAQAHAEAAAGSSTAIDRLDAIADELRSGDASGSERTLAVYAAIGETQYATGRFDQAEATFDRALRLIGVDQLPVAAAIAPILADPSLALVVARLIAGRSGAALLAGRGSRLDPSVETLVLDERTPSLAVRLLAAMRAGERALGVDIDAEMLDELIAAADTGDELPAALSRPVYEPIAAALVMTGRPAESRALLTRLLDRAAERGEIASHVSLLPVRAFAGLACGKIDHALSDATDAIRLDDEMPASSRFAAAPARFVAAMSHLERDELDDAAHVVAVDDASDRWGTSPMHGWFLFGVGGVALARGDIATATTALRRAGGSFMLGGGSGAVVPWRSALATALRRQGHSDEADALVADELAIAQRLGDRRLLAENRHAAAMALADHAAAARALDAARRHLAVDEAPLVHAAIEVDRGRRLRRAGDLRRARVALRSGLDEARRVRSRRLERIAADELVAAGSRRPPTIRSGRDALTPAELRVSSLAAEGRVNRDIADALFVSVKTVETQLSAVYRKLGIAGRSELADALR